MAGFNSRLDAAIGRAESVVAELRDIRNRMHDAFVMGAAQPTTGSILNTTRRGPGRPRKASGTVGEGTKRAKLIAALHDYQGGNFGELARAVYGKDSKALQRNIQSMLSKLSADGVVRKQDGGRWVATNGTAATA
jgi:hypothetical protein